MSKVLEVSSAEDVTGHTNSIAITAPERVTFVKGTCPEESKWWLNVLVAFPKSKGRHKRNATFPGGMAANNSSTNSRNRHNSYHKDSMVSPTIESSWNNVDVDDGSGSNDGDDVTPNGQDENNINAGNEINNRGKFVLFCFSSSSFLFYFCFWRHFAGSLWLCLFVSLTDSIC